MRISDWSSDVCSSDLRGIEAGGFYWIFFGVGAMCGPVLAGFVAERLGFYRSVTGGYGIKAAFVALPILSQHPVALAASAVRSEEHTSELQSLMRSSYAVFCLKKKNNSY